MAFAEKYVSVAGGGAHDGSSEANAWTFAEADAAYAAGDRLNVKVGTHAMTTTLTTLGTAGSTTQPVWWRGYNTTIGDCDSDNTLARPLISHTTGNLTISGAHHIWTSIDVSAARNGATLVLSGSNLRFKRGQVTNTNANSAALAATFSGTGMTIEAAYFSANAAAAQCINITGTNVVLLLNNIVGGLVNVQCTATNTLIRNLLRDAANDGINLLQNNGIMNIIANTIDNVGRDGIRVGGAAATPAWCSILNNTITAATNVGTTGINNVAAAGNTNTLHRSGNRFYNFAADEAGFGDSPAFGALTGGSDPLTSSTNLALASGDAARAAAFVFENLSTTTSYHDLGAVQHQDAGSGGIKSQLGMVGGMAG